LIFQHKNNRKCHYSEILSSGFLIHTVYSVKNNPLAAPRTLTDRQKFQPLSCLKAGIVKELQTKLRRLGVQIITINRWLKQYSAGGREELLKIRQITGRPRLRAYYPKSSKKWDLILVSR
jgi:hypothetical protein